ncbi:MAG: carbamoyltransferase [Alphaproteobacteria bacterium]
MSLILGTKLVDHDCCIALIKDGRPCFVYEYERFNRVKHGRTFDPNFIHDSLAEYGYKADDIDFVTNCIDAAYIEPHKENLRQFFWPNSENPDDETRLMDYHLRVWHEAVLVAGFPESRIVDIRHHMCHCAAVFYPSPFAEAAILSVDGGGEAETTVIAHGRDAQINVLKSIPTPHSLGHFYLAATTWLGWGLGEEGKTMALAAYGRPKYRDRLVEKYIQLAEDGTFEYKFPVLPGTALNMLFGPGRTAGAELTQYHKDVAASVQLICEQIMLRLARTARTVTGARNLLITGGVGLNSVANGLIIRERLFDRVIVYPQASDSGLALGGALHVHHVVCGNDRKNGQHWVLTDAYLGQSVDLENVESVAAEYGLAWSKHDDIAVATAARLAEGRIVGWVQGRSEVGPRALGNRSILADPRVAGIKDKVNAKVKNRELWRPFAPSVLADDCSCFFDADQELPFMTVTSLLHEKWRDALASVAHIDHTARVQTVTKETNPLFHGLLSEFKALTGIGVLLNTSFNGRGEPLVQTARQAIEMFLRSEMEVLVIGPYLFETRPAHPTTVRPFHPAHHNVNKIARHQRVAIMISGSVKPFSAFIKAAIDTVDDLALCGVISAEDRQYLTDIGVSRPVSVSLELAQFDAVVYCLPAHGLDVIFNKQLINSVFSNHAREILKHTAVEVYWLVEEGDVLVARHVLGVFDNLSKAITTQM